MFLNSKIQSLLIYALEIKSLMIAIRSISNKQQDQQSTNPFAGFALRWYCKRIISVSPIITALKEDPRGFDDSLKSTDISTSNTNQVFQAFMEPSKKKNGKRNIAEIQYRKLSNEFMIRSQAEQEPYRYQAVHKAHEREQMRRHL